MLENNPTTTSYIASHSLEYDRWRAKNRYYYTKMKKLLTHLIPPGIKVIELGCGTGELLHSVAPSVGVGVDCDPDMVELAKKKFPEMEFRCDDVENLKEQSKYNYIILSDLLGEVGDVWQSFHELHKIADKNSRVVITSINYLWEPILRTGEKLRMKSPKGYLNWLSITDIERLLHLNGFEVVTSGYYLLLPVYIPCLSSLLNRYVAHLPFFRKLSTVQFLIAKEISMVKDDAIPCYTVSIIIPCRNEQGNIEELVNRTPEMGGRTELIFVDGESTDGTVEKIEEMILVYGNRKNIRLIHQTDRGASILPAVTAPNRMLKLGKGDAVRKGFAAATGDILMILDADLTVTPEELPKFYHAIASGRGEFINGTRLVYQMEKQAMRALNLLANKLFSLVFTWLLGQPVKDTLCGTKVLFRSDYEKIRGLRSRLGELDPFGDFDLLFGAAMLNMKIIEVPVHYRRRTYGEIKIERFKHGLKLLRMSLMGLKEFKFF